MAQTVKNLSAMREMGSISGLERSPGEGNGFPLQYSGLENSMDCILYILYTMLFFFFYHLNEHQGEKETMFKQPSVK